MLCAVVPGLAAALPAPGAVGQPAQTPPAPVQYSRVPGCQGAPLTPPANLPPPDSPPLVRFVEICFPTQGNVSVIEPATYQYYIQTQPSDSRQGRWAAYEEQTVLEDFKRLWATNFLDDLKVDVRDVPYPNGVPAKHVTFLLEERQRVKIIDYEGSKKLDTSKIDEKVKEANAVIRIDSFLDPGLVARHRQVLLEMLAEKGHQFASITPEIKPIAGGPKLVHLTFRIEDGPKLKIRQIDFVGNKAASDGKLARQMKSNKSRWFLSVITGRGTYQEAKFEEDAEKIVEYYGNKGYVMARVGQPELKFLEDSTDGETRWVQLRIPVEEGSRYRIGEVRFDGNTIVKSEALNELLKMKPGDWFSRKRIDKWYEKARELYGSVGYMEFTFYPDFRPRDLVAPAQPPDGATALSESAAAAQAPEPVRGKGGAPLLDITMRIQEGKQYFVNRITFTGNSTTRDNVIRREMQLVENGIFNTEALKFSVRRINQLGYFRPLEGKDDVQVEKTPGSDNEVDVTLKLQEQNRNQVTFGAGVSQFEGFFGQLSFQTSNFLGRGEVFNVALQAGSRAKNYQVSFTEPFLFDRPITAGLEVFKRDIRYISQFTQKSTGGNIIFGFPLASFTRMFINYAYERVKVSEINSAYCDPIVLARNPFLRDALLLGGGTCETGAGETTEIDPLTGIPITVSTITGSGTRTISKIVPSFVHNTIDQPIFPTRGTRYTLSMDFAGLGGNTFFVKPRAEAVWILPHTRRTSLAFRTELEYVRPFGSTIELPIFERVFQGGEYSIRGFDIRTVGPRDPVTGLVLGGNKSLLFNAEYLITIAGPVRLVLFYDAGQVRDRGQSFAWREPVTRTVQTGGWEPALGDLSEVVQRTATYEQITLGRVSAFRTSTGAEIRFFMPVLNVPFRLIFAANPQRQGVLDNNLNPAKLFSFRFAVGSTF